MLCSMYAFFLLAFVFSLRFDSCAELRVHLDFSFDSCSVLYMRLVELLARRRVECVK